MPNFDELVQFLEPLTESNGPGNPSSPQSHPGREQPERRSHLGANVPVHVRESSAEELQLHKNASLDCGTVRAVRMRRNEGAEEVNVTSSCYVPHSNVAAVNDAFAEYCQGPARAGAERIVQGEAGSRSNSEVDPNGFGKEPMHLDMHMSAQSQAVTGHQNQAERLLSTAEANSQPVASESVNQWIVQRNDASQLMAPLPGETVGGSALAAASKHNARKSRRAEARRQMRNSTKHRCPKCHLGHDCHSKMMKHLKGVHPDRDLMEAFRCQICHGGVYFKCKASLTRHMKRQHKIHGRGGWT